MANTQLLVIVAVAMVAGVILFRLYTVLGRRTGNERERLSRFDSAANKAADTVVALPDRNRLRGDAAATRPLDDIEQAMIDIKLADRTFETEHFVAGAKKAHEMIVTAYAKGDRDTLRPLLNDEVFDAFDHAIKDRQSRERNRQVHAGRLQGRENFARLPQRAAQRRSPSVSPCSSFRRPPAMPSGAVIEGDPAAVRDVTDVWTFSRDLRGSDPNWTLVATSGGEF